MKNSITQEHLKSLLKYDPETGIFTWIAPKSKKVKVGDTTGWVDKITGYVRIDINGKHYQAHRLAWLYVYGRFPKDETDHINGDRLDNRLLNLREATGHENRINHKKSVRNTSGFKGVSWSRYHNKWLAQIKLNGKRKFIGYFSTPEEASNAYEIESVKLFGEFKREVSCY